jgi:hypothetical protein
VKKPAEPIESLPPPVEPAAPEPEEEPEEVAEEQPAEEVPTVVIPEVALPPSKDQLTEVNLDRIADVSHAPATETQLSEAADSWDPRAVPSATATPLSASQQQHQAKAAATSGYAASALKATERVPQRTPSYTRRVLDQEEAVRMPSNIDRAAVQFGGLSFTGVDDDIDGDREEPETRAQPPADSPVAHPRTSLPPVQQPAAVPEAYSAQKPAAALPTATGQTGNADFGGRAPWISLANSSLAAPTGPAAQQPAAGTQGMPSLQLCEAITQLTSTAAQGGQFGRFGSGQEQSFGQKPFDSFGQQQQQPSSTPSQLEGYQTQPSSQPQAQAPSQPAGGAFSSAPDQYSSYYTSDQSNRNQYNYYNQNYGQQPAGQAVHSGQAAPGGQAAQGAQEGAAQPGRGFGGFNAPQSDNLSQYPQSGASRYGAAAAAAADVHNSGNTTPNPPGQQAAGAPAGQAQSHGQQPHGSYGYNSNHPYYSNAYYSQYMNHYGGYGQGGYGGPYGKGFGQQHPYGMNPQGPYGNHSTSHDSGFGQSTLQRGDSGLGSGLGEYGRGGSGQQSTQPGLAGTGFGMHDYGRAGAASGYQSQAGQGFGAQSSQPAAPSSGDDLKPFGDASKAAPGPGAAARPGSATNTTSGQAGLPPPQQSGMGGGYGGYPGHGLHGTTGGYGGQGNTGPYGGYNAGGFGGTGGQGSYYAQQQQQGGQGPRGWGNNYS